MTDTDIDAALVHFRIARSHIEQGLEHLAAADRDDDRDGDGDGDDRDTDDYTDLDDLEPGFTLTCGDCGEEFDPWDVTHSIVGPHTAFYSCPNCSNTIRGPEPYLRRDTDADSDETDTDTDE